MIRPRIAICGIHIESSTFTPYVSTQEDFEVLRGPEMRGRYRWIDDDWSRQVDWFPILHARALPGGVVDRFAYEGWKREIVDGLAALVEEAPLDGILFDIHGAMSVEGMDDAEGDLIGAVRAAAGTEPLISASMDLHGNVSLDLFEALDLMTCYRKAPHEDALESRERAARNLVDRIVLGQGKPAKALVHIPILLPGEKTSTRTEPAKGLYAMIDAIEQRDGILDAAIWIGLAWADQPRCKGAAVVTGDDQVDVALQARTLGQAFWDARDDFDFVAPVGTMEQCLEAALEGPAPFFIADSGDNPGAGGAGDVTVALRAALERDQGDAGNKEIIVASILDPTAAQVCWNAGVGQWVEVSVGAKVDARDSTPVEICGEVVALCNDPRGGRTAAIRTGALTVIVTSARNQYSRLEQYLALDLDPSEADVVIVKMGYLEPDLYDAQKGWMMALTPGGVNQELHTLPYQEIDRPMFPLDSFEEEPSLETIVVRP